MKPSAANILDDYIQDILNKEKTVKDCLDSLDPEHINLAPVLMVVGRLAEASDIAPNPKRKAESKTRFLTLVEQKLWERGLERAPLVVEANPARQSVAMRLKLAASRLGAVTVVTSMLSGGAIAMANESLPGNPLYPVKLAVEKARIELARDNKTKSKVYLSIAKERIQELNQINKDNPHRNEVIQAIVVNIDMAEKASGNRKEFQQTLDELVAANKEVFNEKDNPELVNGPKRENKEQSRKGNEGLSKAGSKQQDREGARYNPIILLEKRPSEHIESGKPALSVPVIKAAPKDESKLNSREGSHVAPVKDKNYGSDSSGRNRDSDAKANRPSAGNNADVKNERDSKQAPKDTPKDPVSKPEQKNGDSNKDSGKGQSPATPTQKASQPVNTQVPTSGNDGKGSVSPDGSAGGNATAPNAGSTTKPGNDPVNNSGYYKDRGTDKNGKGR